MSESSNPYEAPTAAPPVLETTAIPPALLATLACYLAHYALQVASMWRSALGNAELFLPVTLVNGTYCLAMCIALWRRWQWARMWVVMTTVVSVVSLLMLARRGAWAAEGLSALSMLLRIAVAPMLFLPSVRRWFALRHG
jgi:hypothetical protein